MISQKLVRQASKQASKHREKGVSFAPKSCSKNLATHTSLQIWSERGHSNNDPSLTCFTSQRPITKSKAGTAMPLLTLF